MSTLTVADLELLVSALGLEVPIPTFGSANVTARPLDIVRSYLAKILQELVPEGAAAAYDAIQPNSNIDLGGDLSVIVPKLKQDTDGELFAIELLPQFPESPLYLAPVPEGVQLRMFLRPENFSKLLYPFIKDRQSLYGCNRSEGLVDSQSVDGPRKKVVIEFSSRPNITTELQGKHLRATILGAQISNLYEAMGWNVTRINYLGDWGKTIGLVGAGFERFGSNEVLEADPVGHLREVYKKIVELFVPEQQESRKARDDGGDAAAREVESRGLFAERNAFFKRMEDGDEKAICFSQHFRDVSVEAYRQLYARLNVSFDEYSGESKIGQDTTKEVIEIMKEKGLIEESGGALTIDLKAHVGRHGTAIIRDRDGSTTYLLRDLAAVLERHKKHDFDKMIYVVIADSHGVHFQKMHIILELMGLADLASKLLHVSFSRNSNAPCPAGGEYTLGEILDRADDTTKKELKAQAEVASVLSDQSPLIASLGISSLFAQVGAVKRGSDMSFKAENLASSQPGTALDMLSLCATLSRLQEPETDMDSLTLEDRAVEQNEKESALLRLLGHYPEVVQSAYRTVEPALIMAFLAGITDRIKDCVAIGEKGIVPASMAQKELLQASATVLKAGLSLLGVMERNFYVELASEVKANGQGALSPKSSFASQTPEAVPPNNH